MWILDRLNVTVLGSALALFLGVALADTAIVWVSNQNSAAREEALRTALSEVLTKHTARFDVREEPAFAQAFEQPELWLDAYRYEAVGQGWDLKLQFNESKIQQLLAAGPVLSWGTHRPHLVLWLRWATPQEAHWVSEDAVLLEQMHQAADTVGLPIIMPTLDLETLDGLEATPSSVAKASRAYRAEGWILAELRAQEAGWSAHWSFGDERFQWHNTLEADSLELLIYQGMTQTAQQWIQYSATEKAQAPQGPIRLYVQHITKLEDYTNLMKILSPWGEDEGLRLVAIDKDLIVLELRPKGGASALLQALRTETHLVGVDISQISQLKFRWVS